jgi:branched-chain amino acid aminotransferase
MTAESVSIETKPVAKSRIDSIDFDNLMFGRSFADHNFIADYRDGEWTDLRVVPFENLSMSPANMTLHYGQTIFEGMKAYKNADGEVLVFRPWENHARLNKSAVRMCMPEVSEEIFMGGLSELLRLDAAWVPTQEGSSLYIRPFMFATDEYIGVSPSQTYKFMIFTCPVGAYYSKPLRVKVETEYIRAARGGVGFSKNAGNYGGSLYPAKLAQQQGYDQIIWTDASEHRYVEEAGTMNLMFVIDGVLTTAPTGGTILDGVTRKSVLQIAREWGMPTAERLLSIDEVREAIEKGTLQETFGAGTAAVIAPINCIGIEGIDYQLPELTADSFAKRVYREIDDVRTGRKADTRGWVYKV